MIRQIVLNDQVSGKKAVGLLMVAAPLDEYNLRRLGERLIRAGGPTHGYLGIRGGRYQFRMLDWEMTDPDTQTICVGGTETHLEREDGPVATVGLPDGRKVDVAVSHDEAAALASIIAKARDAAEMYPPSDMTALLPNPRPCDRAARWLWPMVAIVGLVIVIAGVR